MSVSRIPVRSIAGLLALAASGAQGAEASRSEPAGREWQPLQIAQAPEQRRRERQQPSDWSYTAGARVYYDSFKSDDGLIESEQVAEMLSFTASRRNLWYPSDTLSISVDGGFVQAWPERGPRDRFVDATPTDILLSGDYSTWDGKTSGFTVGLFVNLPTGPDNFDIVEAAAVPNPHVVSVSPLSSGLHIGGEAQYHRQIERWHLHGGFGYVFRGGTTDFRGFDQDELAGGHDVSVLLGADNQISERLNIGIDAVYTYSIERRTSNNHFVAVTVPLTYLFERGEVSLAYGFSYGTSENRELTGVFKAEELLEGVHHTVSLDAAYKLAEPLIVRGLAEVSLGSADRPDDPAFFATGNRYLVGAGLEYALAENVKVEALAKYFEVATKGAVGGSTTFDGFSGFVGLTYGF